MICENRSCSRYQRAVEVAASWARIGVNCRVCGLELADGLGDGPVEVVE